MNPKAFNPSLPSPEPREGDVYAEVELFEKRFQLKYGYYDERDRAGPPDVIYPDFIKEPVYTSAGEPLATMMQDACPHYLGDTQKKEDAACGECSFFERGPEWFGRCRSPSNKKNLPLNKPTKNLSSP